MSGPRNVGVVGGQLGDNFAGCVIAVDAKTNRLTLERAGSVLVEAGAFGGGMNDLRTKEKFGLTIADASDSDGRINRGANDGAVGRLRLIGHRPPKKVRQLRRFWL